MQTTKIALKFSLTLFLLVGYVSAQSISGVVSSEDGPLPGVSIVEKGTSNGTTTDIDGQYSISVSEGATLVYSFVGYATQEMPTSGKSSIDVTMSGGVELENVVLVGSRTLPRSNTNTPLPVDVLTPKDITSTGQNSFDKALQYRVPSFNTVQTPVNDATSLLDPYEIRNMGPSRTLILINGKRKNTSALLYTQTSPGRGETGADISAIPQNAIQRVEILRDGASAQYGSDAIAGVMNIILKEGYDAGTATLNLGVTGEGDGETIGFSLNNGAKIGEDGGYINYTIDLSKVNLANRPGTVSAEGEAADFGADIATVREFLGRNPDAGNVNGSPETTAAKFLINGGFNLSESTSLYFNAAYVFKKVNSFANYRTPYWRTISDFPYLSSFFPAPGTPNNYDGYVPTFDGDLNDFNGTIGVKSEKNGWDFDVSYTTGGNSQTYRVRNSHNRSDVVTPATWTDTDNDGVVDAGELVESSLKYRENSQLEFDPGGTFFMHNVGNIDISKQVNDRFSIALGSEFRSELFTVIEGELASYEGGGPDSFSGNDPQNSGTFTRYNFGGYLALSFDLTKDFLVEGTARFENYSDFGDAFVYKASSRYKFLNDKMTIRGSFSTGFRAPLLHQIYTQKAQYSFVPGQGIQVGGLINNVSPAARFLGLPKLKAEKSTNITVGLGGKLSSNFNFTIDYYNIAVEDRIVLSTEIGKTTAGTSSLDQILNANNINDLSFFVNALDTRTSGIDVVVNYKNLLLGPGKLDITLSGNYTLQNEREGDVKNPTLVADAGQSVVNLTQEALFFTSRPQTKWILGLNYDVNDFTFSLNNTYFGETKFRQQGINGSNSGLALSDIHTRFKPAVVTDLSITYRATEHFTLTATANNLLNILPEWEFVGDTSAGQAVIDDTTVTGTGLTTINNISNAITFNQRYSQMTYDGYHFSQLGSIFNVSLSYQF